MTCGELTHLVDTDEFRRIDGALPSLFRIWLGRVRGHGHRGRQGQVVFLGWKRVARLPLGLPHLLSLLMHSDTRYQFFVDFVDGSW